MRRPSGLWLSILAALANLAPLAARPAAAIPPAAYSAAEIRGRVVDAETKQPIEGVHVVAQWILNTGLLHSEHVVRLHILETVTSPTGEFYFSRWGPKVRPPLSQLDDYDPLLTFFKPGYRSVTLGNRTPHDDPVRTSIWNGKTISLNPFRGTLEEWALLLSSLQGRLAWGDPIDDVGARINDYWRYFPRIVLAITEQRRLLPTRFQDRVSTLDIWGVTESDVRAAIE